MLKKIFVGFILLNITVVAISQSNNWIEVASDVNGSVWQMRDLDIVNTKDYSPRIWLKIDHSKDKTISHRSTLKLISFDCRNLKSQTLQVSKYNAKGNSIGSWDDNYRESSHIYVVPDSVLESVMTYACPLKEK